MEPLSGGGYRVDYLEHPTSDDGQTRRGTVTADRLILSAGALGTTYLLLRNRAAFPRISGTLGTRFCGNGDLLTFAIKASEGTGEQRRPRVIDPGHGPVITIAIRVDDAVDGGQGRGFYLEDAGFPEHVGWMLHVFASVRPLTRLAERRVAWDWFGKGPDPRLGSELSSLFGDTELSAGLLPMLGMGRDIPDGHMRLRAGRLHVDWTKQKSGPYFDRVRETAKAMAHQLGAHFVDDPLWYLNRLITVHPLGGCPMGRDAREGVVDTYGEVFGYPGLYVADGSVMPGPVGVNPSLTIAALADRSAESLLTTTKRRIAR